MKIGIMTWGSEGDVRPFLALAAGLATAGHRTTLAVSDIMGRDHSAVGGRFGFEVRAVGSLGLDREAIRRLGAEVIAERDVLRQLRMIVERFQEPLIEAMLAAAESLVAENDLVIGHLLAHPLQAAARKAGRPHVAVHMMPGIPSRYLTPPDTPRLGRFANLLFWKLGDYLITRSLAPSVNRLRGRLGLPPARSMMREVWWSDRLNLVATSPTLCPAPPDWPPQVAMCGFLGLPGGGEGEGDGAKVPLELARFLDSGAPPVYLTLGSMAWADPAPADTAVLLAEGARLAGCRAVLQTDAPVEAGPNVLVVSRVPHAEVFPRCVAVVHHGGAGTTQTATQAGCPSVVVVHASDQIYWAETLHRAGIAPRPLRRTKLAPERLARAIREVLASPAMAGTARRIGSAMRDEDGVARAVELVGNAL